jgi:hypothetical protein
MADYRPIVIAPGERPHRLLPSQRLEAGTGVVASAGAILSLVAAGLGVQLGANDGLSMAPGTGAADFSGGSGAFKTTTGAVTIGPGAVAVSGAASFTAGGTALSVTNDAAITGAAAIGTVKSGTYDAADGTPAFTIANGTGAVSFQGAIVAGGDLTVTGNLVVNGSTTTVNSTVLDIADRVVHVNHSTGANDPVPSAIAGWSVHRGAVGGVARDHAGVFWVEASQGFRAAFNTAGDDSTVGADLGFTAGAITATSGVTSSGGAFSLTGSAPSTLTTAAASTALTITAGAASVWSTSAGTLSLSGGSGINLQNGGTTSAIVDGAQLQLQGGISLTGVAGAGGIALGSLTGNTQLPTGNLAWAGAAAKTGSFVAQSTFTITAGASSTWSTSSGALSLVSAAAATWGTTAGVLTLCGGGGLTLVGAGASSLSTSSGPLTLNGFGGITVQKAGATYLDHGVTAASEVTLAANINLTAATGSSAFKWGSASGEFTFPTGSLAWTGASNKTLNLTAAGASGTFTLDAGTATVSLFASANARTINFGTGAAIQTVHLFDGAAANVVTLGSTTGAASLTFKAGTGGFTLSQGAASSGTPTGVVFTGAAHTNLAQGLEATDVNWNLARTVQFDGSGSITTQRAFVVQAPTYAFTVGSTITNAATLAVTGAPTAGTNATLTNKYALWVQAGQTELDGALVGTAGWTQTGGNVSLTGSSGSSFTLGNTGGAAALTLQSGTGGSVLTSQDRINITAANNSTWKTTAGTLTIDAGTTLKIGTAAVAIALTGAASTTYTVGDANTTGQITLGQSTATNTISVGDGATANSSTQTITIGTGVTSTTTGRVVVNIGTGSGRCDVTVGSAGADSIGLPSTLTLKSKGTISICDSADARTWNVGTGAAIQTVNLFTGNSGHTINFATGTTAVTANLCTGAAAHAITIGTSGTAAGTTIIRAGDTGTITVGDSTSSNTVKIAAATTGSNIQTVIVGSNGLGAICNKVTIGNYSSTTASELRLLTDKISFFSLTTPVTKQTATGTLANLISILQSYGLVG